MLQPVFQRCHAKFLPEDVDEVLGSDETDVCCQLTHIDIGALQQDAGMFQT